MRIPLAIGLNTITVTATDATGSVSRHVSVTRRRASRRSARPDDQRSSRHDHLRDDIALGNRKRRQRRASRDLDHQHGRIRRSDDQRHELDILSIPLAIGLNTITVTAADATGSVSARQRDPRDCQPSAAGSDDQPSSGHDYRRDDVALGNRNRRQRRAGSKLDERAWAHPTERSISGTNWVISNIPLAIGVNTITVTAADATGSVSRSVSVTRTGHAPGPDTTGPDADDHLPVEHLGGDNARLADIQGHRVGPVGSRQRDLVDQYGRGRHGVWNNAMERSDPAAGGVQSGDHPRDRYGRQRELAKRSGDRR